MLKPEQIKDLESLLKITGLAEAIASPDPVEITIPAGILYSEEEVSTLKNNEYKAGKEKGVEMAVKDTKEKMGLDFQGKTIEGLLAAAKAKALEDAKIEPAEKVKELETKVQTLQATVVEQETKLAAKATEVETVLTNTELFKHIPAPGENGPALSQEDILQLMRAKGYEFKRENNAVVAYKDGKQQQDKVANPLPVGDVITGFLKETKLVQEQHQPGGRGGDDNKPPMVFTKMSEVKDQFKAQGKSLLGQEFAQAVAQAKTQNQEFDMNA